MKPGFPEKPVPPEVVARINRVLAERNVDGKVPYDIAMCLLDDMHAVACRVSLWSHATFKRYGLLACCHHCHPKENP